MKMFLFEKCFGVECRIILFKILGENTVFDMEEVVADIFPELVLINISPSSGVLIEKGGVCSDKRSKRLALLSMLQDDFPVEIAFFYLPFRLLDQSFQDQIYRLEHIFNQCLINKNVSFMVTPPSAFLIMYQHHEESSYRFLANFLLAPIVKDQELLHTVKTYIENFSNATVTARKLFIHRNGLLYRLDKFLQKTEIDLRNYNESLATYLAIKSL